MYTKVMSVLLALLLACPLLNAQELPPPDVTASSFKTEGLELPPDVTVSSDEGFLNIQAKCKGSVKWLVIAGVKVKYVTNDSNNSIIVSVPANAGVITVFAIGLVEGKQTDFARTNITVKGGINPNPNPVDPPVNPVTGPLFFTVVLDLNNTTPELAAVLNSQAIRKAITDRGGLMTVYDAKSPVVAQKKFDSLVARIGGPTLIVQKGDGKLVIPAQGIPKTEQEFISLVSKLTGGN